MNIKKLKNVKQSTIDSLLVRVKALSMSNIRYKPWMQMVATMTAKLSGAGWKYPIIFKYKEYFWR